MVLVIVLERKYSIDLEDRFGRVVGKHWGILDNLVFA